MRKREYDEFFFPIFLIRDKLGYNSGKVPYTLI
jgi:hypothetical protein